MLRQLDYLPQIVFTTAYDHYAVTAFELHAVDYLLKPFTRARFADSVARLLDGARPNAPPSKVRWCAPAPGRRRSIASSCATVAASFRSLRTRSNT